MSKTVPAIEIAPLEGQWLIEASAGTGKTWTLTGLLLRLLLESDRHPREIIATTFTRKAAAEMRRRTNLRFDSFLALCQALSAQYHQLPTIFTDVAQLQAQLDVWASDGAHAQHEAAKDLVNRYVLLEAAKQGVEGLIQLFRRVDRRRDEIDELFIGTLDSLCQRWLKEFAVETGSSHRTLVDDQADVIQTLVYNELRQILQESSDEEIGAFLNQGDLSRMVKEISQALNFYDAEIETFSSPLQNYLHRYTQLVSQSAYQTALTQFCALSPADILSFADRLLALPEQMWLASKKKFRAEIAPFFHQLCVMVDNAQQLPLFFEQQTKFIDAFFINTDSLWLKKHLADVRILFDQHPLPAIIRTLYSACREQLPSAKQAYENEESYQYSALLLQVYQRLRNRLPNYLERRGESTFSEQIYRLNQALQGPEGEQLARYITHRYPVLLIDESQDLNGSQAKLLKNLYFTFPSEKGFLLLVGDPKQAIYHFRGGDVANYLDLKEQFPDEHICTLNKNFRSSSAIVHAINHLYGQNDKSKALGKGIHYEMMQAEKRAGHIVYRDGRIIECPIHWYGIEKIDEDYAQILTLIQQLTSAQSPYVYRQSDGQLRPIRCGDIMVLLTSHDKLTTLQKILHEHQIDTAYSAQENIFAQDIAVELSILLQSFLQPQNRQLQRRLLSGIFFGKTQADLTELEDISAGKIPASAQQLTYESLSQQLKQGGEHWQQGNLLHAIQTFCNTEFDKHTIWQRLAQFPYPQRERYLLDLRQIQRIIAEHSHQRLPSNFLQWWQTALYEKPSYDWALATPLSGEDRVRLMTIHAAKGLEAPVVIIGSRSNRTSVSEKIYSYHNQDNHTVISSLPNNSTLNIARYKTRVAEQQDEKMRQFYVALTRAAELLFIGYTVKSTAQEINRLIENTDIDTLAGHQTLTIPTLLPQNAEPSLLEPVEIVPQSETIAPPYRQTYFSGWRRTSFSALARDYASHHTIDVNLPDYATETAETNLPTAQDIAYPFRFPRGTAAGSYLHELLEKVDARELASHTKPPPAIRLQIEHLLEKYALTSAQYSPEQIDQMALYQWMREVVTTPLQPSNITLSQIAPAHRANEMSFMLATNHQTRLNIDAINVLMKAWGKPVELQNRRTMIGFLRGEIDLCYQHEGRYYVLDYKSNHLGERIADYHHSSLTQAMDEHHYWLQALIYQTALHRWLASRLSDYQPETHLAPVNYYFLRGGRVGQLLVSIPTEILLTFNHILEVDVG